MQLKNEKKAEFLKIFGKNLQNARKKRDISRPELAKKIGLTSPSQLSRYEAGQNLPDLFSLVKISNVLEVDLHWLATGKPSPMTKEHKEALADSVRRLRYVCNAYSSLLHEKETALVKELDALNARRKAGETIDEPHAQELLSEHSKIVEQFNHIHSAINTLPAITADL